LSSPPCPSPKERGERFTRTDFEYCISALGSTLLWRGVRGEDLIVIKPEVIYAFHAR